MMTIIRRSLFVISATAFAGQIPANQLLEIQRTNAQPFSVETCLPFAVPESQAKILTGLGLGMMMIGKARRKGTR